MADVFQYRECRATITARIPDTPDADQHPDRVLVQGRGTAHPQFQGGSVVFTEIGEYAIPQPIPVVIVDGELLVEVLSGDETVTTQPLFLPVTVDERANQNWSWRLVFDFLTLGEYGEEVTHPPLSFPVEAGDGPLEISSVATPQVKSSGFFSRGPRGYTVTEVTSANGELTFEWEDGSQYSVPIPEAVQGVGVQDATQPTAGVMALTLTDGSTTSQVTLPPGPPGQDGSNVLPTDEAIAQAVSDDYSATAETLSSVYSRWDGLPINVSDPRFGGLVSDGDLDTRAGTDNYQTFLNAIMAAKSEGNRAVYVPAGTYSVSKTIPLPSGVTLRGDGPGQCRIVCPTPGVPVIASESWLTEFGGWPGGRAVVEGILVRAEALSPDSHGIVIRDYHSTIRNCVAQVCGGDGFRADAASQSGTLIGNTLVENYYETLFADRNRGWGFRQNATNGTQLTDAHMMNVVARGLAQEADPNLAEAQGGIYIGFAAGWQVTKVHTYGRFRTDGIVFGNCWGGSVLDGAHIEQGYEGTGLRMPNFQRAGMIDNLVIAMSEHGDKIMLGATKHASLYPGEPLSIGTLQLVSNFSGAGTGVSWNTRSADMRISNLSLAGERTAGISLLGGFGEPNIKVSTDTRVLAKVRDSSTARTLTVADTPLAIGDAQSWGGSGAKEVPLTLPPMTNGTARQFILSMSSSVNFTGTERAKYVALVAVGLSNSGVPQAYVTDILPPVGFAVPPSVSVTTAPTYSAGGVLSISFTPEHSDGWGSASLIGGQA